MDNGGSTGKATLEVHMIGSLADASTKEQEVARPRAAIIGSIDESRSFDPPLHDPAGARRACEEVGRELAVAGWDLAVYSAKPAFIEAAVVRGFVESGEAPLGSIHVHAPIGKETFTEHGTHPELFDLRPDASGDWEIAFYRSLLASDGIFTLGGGQSTLVAGVVAAASGLPVVAAAGFGGKSRRVWERLSEATGQSESDLAEMARPWQADLATRLVQVLDRQRRDREAAAKAAKQSRRLEQRRMHLGLAMASSFVLLAVLGLVLAWSSSPSAGTSIAILALSPMCAAVGGALAKTSLDVGRAWGRAAVLGGLAGFSTGLLYIASQLIGAPDILQSNLLAAVQRLLFFVIPIGFIAGLTFESIYATLRRKDVSQASTLAKF